MNEIKNPYYVQASERARENLARVTDRARWLIDNGHARSWGHAIEISERHERDSHSDECELNQTTAGTTPAASTEGVTDHHA